MKISIITCCKNSMPFIKKNISSVKSQNYKNFEHIFIVSKSSDRTGEFLKTLKYSKKKLYLLHKSLYECLNFGLSKAKGEIIFILHSDDFLSNKNTFKKVSKIFKKKKDVIFGNINFCKRDDENKIIRQWKGNFKKKNFFFPSKLPAHTSLFIKKNFYKSVGIYNTNYEISSDYDFMIRLFSKFDKNFYYMNSQITTMRYGGISTRINKLFKRVYEDLIILIKFNKILFIFLYVYKIFKKILQFYE